MRNKQTARLGPCKPTLAYPLPCPFPFPCAQFEAPTGTKRAVQRWSAEETQQLAQLVAQQQVRDSLASAYLLSECAEFVLAASHWPVGQAERQAQRGTQDLARGVLQCSCVDYLSLACCCA